MLKIKDNVDLKELEKFGFIEETYDYCLYFDGLYHKEFEFIMRVYKETRKIEQWIEGYEQEFDKEKALEKYSNALYDLIQAGLVEKVE